MQRYFTYVGAWGLGNQRSARVRNGADCCRARHRDDPHYNRREHPTQRTSCYCAREPAGPADTPARDGKLRRTQRGGRSRVHGFSRRRRLETSTCRPSDMCRKASSAKGHGGLDLSELRLKSGLLQRGGAVLYAASIKSIVALSRSAEMVPWKLGTTYDRPISRRIVEGAGVPARSVRVLERRHLGGGDSRPTGAELRRRYFEYVSRNVLPSPWCYARLGLDQYTMRSAGARLVESRTSRLGWKRLGAALLEPFSAFHEGYSWYGSRNHRSTLYSWAAMELVGKLRERGVGAPISRRQRPARRAIARHQLAAGPAQADGCARRK